MVTLSTTEEFHVTGDLADKIKNNVKTQAGHFSWKLKFPKKVKVDALSLNDIMIFNKRLNKMRCEFLIYTDENSVLISPHGSYKQNQEYFFWAKYNQKEICVAFMLTETNELRTFDQKTSIQKLNICFKKGAKKPVVE